MSEFHPLNNDRSVPQSEALPTMGGGGSHVINEGDMNPNDCNTTAYNVALVTNTSNSHHPDEMAAPWGCNHPSVNATYNNNNHRAHPPHPHGSSYPHPHEPPHHHHHHHGGYHHPTPYTSSQPPHYAYPTPHDSHYQPHHHPPPPHHHSSVHHYPPKYNHTPPQMYHPHHPGYYHHQPPPQYHPHHHYHPPHHHHGMSPHGSYPPPPHYSMAPQEVIISPSIPPHQEDASLNSSSSMHHHMHMNHTANNQHPNGNLVTPTIYTASPPSSTTTAGGACSSDAITRMFTPDTSSLHENDKGGMNSPATKELFASTPHYLLTASKISGGAAGGAIAGGGGGRGSCESGGEKQYKRKQQVHKSILSKGLLPLDYNKDDDAGAGDDNVKFTGEDSLLLPGARYEPPQKNTTDQKRTSDDDEVVHHTEWTAANTTTQISSGGGTSSPHQLAEVQSISNQARAQIAKMKKQQQQQREDDTIVSRQVLQVESQRVADIACEDVAFGERASSPDEEAGVAAAGGGGGVTAPPTAAANDASTTNNATTATENDKTQKKPHQTRYKDKDGFIYYRRVGNKHYKKLFEKGLVPKDNDGEVEERVNAIQIVTTAAAAVEKDGGGGGSVESGVGVPVVHLPTGEDGKDEAEDGKDEVEEREQPLQLPRSRVRDTQLLYSHDETRTVSSSDGYELRVVPHDDGNDFHVELIKPEDVLKGEESLVKQQQHHGSSVEENSSLPSMESEKLEDGGLKKNDGEFDTAVDSILDAAETIAKRATPRSSPVSLPGSQYQQTDLPGVSSATKRKCEDMIQGYQEEKRQRSNSGVAFHPRAYPAPTTFSYPPPDTVRPSPPPHETSSVAGPSPQSHASEPAPNNAYSQIICQDRKEKRGRRTYCYPHPSVDLTEYYSSRQVTKTKKEELTALALCAASHIQKEPVLFRAILLNMALERERYSPKKHSGGAPTHLKNLALKRLSLQNGSEADIAFLSAVESSGKKVIRDGFFWKDVPELEKVLQKHMMEYYFMSENRPQSKKQQQFNNRLVSLVYQEAIARGFVFDPVSFSLDGHSPLEFPSTTAPTECAGNWIVPPGFNHKKLRDRIRCYYKTHVQNSKKRLGTLLKNPNKERNRDILLRLVNELRSQEHIELSSECVVALKRLKAEQDSIKGTVSTPDGTSPETTSRPSARHEFDDHSQETTTTPYSSRATISDGGSGSSSSTSSHSVQNPHAAPQPVSTMFSPFKHASLLSSMRQLDSQRH